MEPEDAGTVVNATSEHFDIVKVSATRIARFFSYQLDIEMKQGAARAPLRAHVVGLPAKNRLDLVPMQARDATGAPCARLSRILGACRENPETWGAVLGAANGGFFIFTERLASTARRFQPRVTRVGDPAGFLACNGRIRSLPLYGRPALMREASGRWRLDRPGMKDTAVILRPPGGESVRLVPESVNDSAAPAHAVAAYTPGFGRSAPPARGAAFLTLIGDALAAVRTRGAAPIPANGAVLRAPRDRLVGIELTKNRGRETVEYAMSPAGVERLCAVHQALECGPQLVRDGQPLDINPAELADQGFVPGTPPFPAFNSVLTHYRMPAPRLVAGFNDKNDVFLLLFEGRQPGVSEGVTLSQAAILAQAFGCTQALNLDGGASAQIILGNNSLNVPQLGEGQAWMQTALRLLNRRAIPGTLPGPQDLGAGEERTIGSALLIVAMD